MSDLDDPLDGGYSFGQLVDDRSGKPTPLGTAAMKRLASHLCIAFAHLDDTNAPCRIDLDGHDCCSICNDIGGALRGMAKAS